MQNGLPGPVGRKHLPKHRLPSLPRNRADKISFEAVQDADSEALLRAPGRRFSGGVPHADPPPGLLPGIKRKSVVRDHHLVRGFHLSGLPEVRAYLDFVGGLLHGLVRTDLPAEMRLGAVNAERLYKPLAPEVVYPERRMAGGQQTGCPDQGENASHRVTRKLGCRLRASSGASPDGTPRPPWRPGRTGSRFRRSRGSSGCPYPR